MQYRFNGAKFSHGLLSKLGNPRIVDQSRQAYSIALCIWYATFCSDWQPTEHSVSCYVFDWQGCILIRQSYQVALPRYEMLDTPPLGLRCDWQPTEHSVSCYVFDQQGCILIRQSYQVALPWYEMLDTPPLGLHGADPIMYSFA